MKLRQKQKAKLRAQLDKVFQPDPKRQKTDDSLEYTIPFSLIIGNFNFKEHQYCTNTQMLTQKLLRI